MLGDAQSAAQRVAIAVAGGTGERFGVAGGKQLALVNGYPVLYWSLKALLAAGMFDVVIVVCHPDRLESCLHMAVEPLAPEVPVKIVAAGATRQESVMNGLAVLPDTTRLVAIHDGARPLVEPQTVQAVVMAAEGADVAGAVLGHPSVDTLKVAREGRVVDTPDRSLFWAVQTPQVFKAEPLLAAYERAQAEGFSGTDDASIVEHAGGVVVLVEGPRDNIKITMPEDIVFAEAVLAARRP